MKGNGMKETGKLSFTFIVPLAILAIVRVVLGVLIGIWYPAAQLWDDQLMVSYMAIGSHFKNPVYYSLVKVMGWPVIVNLFSKTGLPYAASLSIMCVGAATAALFLLKRLFKGNKVIMVIGYIYVLFMPQAFDIWSGTRFYRTAMIAPFAFITFCFMIQSVLSAREKGVFKILTAVFTGLFFSVTYFLKEDGKWILACLLAATVIGVGYSLYGKKLKDTGATVCKNILVLLIPLIIFTATDLSYRAVNYKYFGVFDVNTRLESEFGSFCAKVYSVESPNRNLHVWAPYDAIEKVFAASPTLSQHENLLNAILTTSWCDNDIKANPIPGDLFAWILRNCLKAEGMYTSEADVKAFFKQVNGELEDAFKDGTLKKQKGALQLFKATGAFTSDEIKEILHVTGESFNGAITLKGYNAGIGEVPEEEILDNWSSVDGAIYYSNTPYLEDYSKQKVLSDKFIPVINVIFFIYKYINIAICLLSCGIILFEVVKFIVGLKSARVYFEKNYKIFFLAVTALMFLGVGLCYAFSISWFSTFVFSESVNMTILNFYNIALPGLLFFAYTFAICSLYHEINLKRGSMSNE